MSNQTVSLFFRVHVIKLDNIRRMITHGKSIFRYIKRNRCSLQKNEHRFFPIFFKKIIIRVNNHGTPQSMRFTDFSDFYTILFINHQDKIIQQQEFLQKFQQKPLQQRLL